MRTRQVPAGLVAVLSAFVVSGCGQQSSATTHATQGDSLRQLNYAAPSSSEPSPHWLPPGATKSHSKSIGRAKQIAYKLSGKANESVPETDESLAAALAAHPPTEISFVFAPVGSLTPPVDDPVLYVTRAISVGDSPGTLVEQNNGLGGVTLSWRSESIEFQLSTQRLKTADGQSGVSDDDLMRMAESVS